MVGLFSALVLLCTHNFSISTSDFNAKLTAVEHVLHVLAHHSQIIAQTWWTSINSCQICPNVILSITRSCKHFIVHISRKEMITWHGMWQSLQPHYCIVGNEAFIRFTKLAKRGTWHCHLQWQCTRSCVTYMMQEGYQWKEDELLFTYRPHVNIQTMGFSKWITFFFDTHCIMKWNWNSSILFLFWARFYMEVNEK